MMEVYGTSDRPGRPGTWQRDVWHAFRMARVGEATGRNRWRLEPPFSTRGGLGDRALRVTSGDPKLPYGRTITDRGWLTHIPRTVLFAWHKGVLAGRAVAWWCGARSPYFRLTEEPETELCVMCAVRLARGR